MSYDSRVTGRIEIQPPLRWSVVRDSKFLPTTGSKVDVRYEVIETAEGTDDGVILRRTAVAVVAASVLSYTAYHLGEHLAEIGNEIHDAGSACSGYLVRSGCEQGDVERYGFDPNLVVVREKALLRWPDGSEVEA